jgi:hypothetical protein
MLQDTNALSAQIERGQKLVSERFSARSRMLEIEREYLALLKRREAPRMRIAKKNCTR